MTEETPTPNKPKVLSDTKRIERVFASQGRAPRLAKHLPESYRQRLLEVCDEHGNISDKAPAEFAAVMRELINEQKAAVKDLNDEEKET